MRMEHSNRAMMQGMLDICRVLEEKWAEKYKIIAQNRQLTEKTWTGTVARRKHILNYSLRNNPQSRGCFI